MVLVTEPRFSHHYLILDWIPVINSLAPTAVSSKFDTFAPVCLIFCSCLCLSHLCTSLRFSFFLASRRTCERILAGLSCVDARSTFASGIRNPASCCCGIRNPRLRNPGSNFHRQSTRSPEYMAWNPESKTVLDSLTLGTLNITRITQKCTIFFP